MVLTKEELIVLCGASRASWCILAGKVTNQNLITANPQKRRHPGVAGSTWPHGAPPRCHNQEGAFNRAALSAAWGPRGCRGEKR